MEKKQLIEKRKQLLTDLDGFVDLVKTEKRKLTDDEDVKFKELKAEIENTNNEIEAKQENRSDEKITKKITNKRMNEKYSLIKAINNYSSTKTLDERSIELTNLGTEEFRSSSITPMGTFVLPSVNYRATMVAGTDNLGGELIDTDMFDLITPLRKASILTQLGATFIGGLKSDVVFPKMTGNIAYWASETEEAGETNSVFSSIKMTPHRITAVLPISKQLLLQSTPDIENKLRNDIVEAVREELEKAVFSGATMTNAPDSLFNGVTYSVTTSAVTFKDFVDLEIALEEKYNINDKVKYLGTPYLKSLTKTKSKSSTSPLMIQEGTEINGYNTVTSTLLPKNIGGTGHQGVIMGDFSQLYIGNWGGIDLTVDNLTGAQNAKVKLIINVWFDFAVLRPEAFVFGKMK